jgi:glutamyl-tRNA synthetase
MKVRFPPSPTGPMHIGTARTLLVNFLSARGQDGKIVFRSEDTDRERSTPEFEQEIVDGIKWLGLDFDEGPFRQSERYEIYEQKFEELKKSGKIYPCFCSTEELEAERKIQNEKKLPPRYSGKCRDLTPEQIQKFEDEGRKAVWRFRVPERTISFVDLVRGEIREEGQNIADFVIRKSDGQFLYHFTVVVDDSDMGITHVIRGEDHISNTSKHILLFEALGVEIPEFAHLPLLLNKDKSKMSKRDESGKPATIKRLDEDGYLPEAVVNFLALLGWNPGEGSEQEFFTMAELQKEFDFKHVAKAGAVFDLERLNFFNAHYLRQLPLGELVEKIKPFLNFEVDDEETLKKAVKLASERMKFFGEANDYLHYFFGELTYAAELFESPKMKVDSAKALNSLEKALPTLEGVEDWNEEEIQKQLFALIEGLGMKNGEMLWPLRVALTGEKFSPGVWEMCTALGKEKSLSRIQAGLDKLKKVS